MYVLALSASPRPGGNTDLLVDRVIQGVRDAWAGQNQTSQHTLEKIRLADLHIQPCTQCDYCLQHDACPLQDDMQALYPKLAGADHLILGSPIYFMAHCAQAKLFIDRCQLFWALQYHHKQPAQQDRAQRRALFIAAGATHGPQVFAGALVTMKWLLDSLGMSYWDNLLYEGLDVKGAVLQHPSALEDAYQAGRRLVRDA